MKRVVITSAVLASIVEMMQEHIGEVPTDESRNGMIELGEALNVVTVACGGSTDKRVAIELRPIG